ncbi:MAG TPA: DNA-binding domain-containing protein [Albitalea sp.]
MKVETGVSKTVEAEGERQRELLAALFAPRADACAIATRETGARALRGLQAYRLNGDAAAQRALAAAFPTVQMLLGPEDFDQLAREFWRAAPPRHGDLGEWGDGFAAAIAAHAQLADWPYLSDCARLDWALHCCERAADAALDAGSLARLSDTDAGRLMPEFMPGMALVESCWPIVSIHAAHRAGDDAAFEPLRELLARRQGESAIVSRSGWRAIVSPVDAATARWTRRLLAGCDLGAALSHAGEGFDFGAWLAAALQQHWLKGIRVLDD